MSTKIEQMKSRSIDQNAGIKSMNTFFAVWSGQVVSVLGSSMTGFALGIWIYQQTGSAIGFALTLLFNMLPKALVAPLAGVLADRYDRRKLIIFSDSVAGIATMLISILFVSGNLLPFHIYVLTAINASASAMQGPAFGASVTQIVPKAQFGRANGMLQLGEGIGQVIAPALAGIFIGAFGLTSILLFDVATFLFAVSILLFIRFPKIQNAEEQKQEVKSNWIVEIKQAIGYLQDRPGLLGLILVFSLVNFFVGIAEAVLTPMILSFSTPEKLAMVMTIGGFGLLSGSLLITLIGTIKRKVNAIFGAYALLSVGVLMAGLNPSIGLVSAALFMAFFFLPTVMSTSQSIMQTKIAPEIQGRVFGLRFSLNTFSFALAFLIGGFLADRVFEPLMLEGNFLADLFGNLIGVGPGRGMGLMFVLMGGLSILTALSAFIYPRIRYVEDELPDMVEN